MPIEYEVDKQVAQVVATILTYHELASLAQHKVKVLSVAKIEMDKDGEPKPCKRGKEVVVQKATDFDAVLTDAKLFVIVNRYWWDNVDEVQREAVLFNHLKRMGAEKNKEGELKLTRYEWDVQLMVPTAQRYGVFTPVGLELFEAMKVRHLPGLLVAPQEGAPVSPDTGISPPVGSDSEPEPEPTVEPEPERLDRPATPVRRVGQATQKPVNNPSVKK